MGCKPRGRMSGRMGKHIVGTLADIAERHKTAGGREKLRKYTKAPRSKK